MQDKDNDRGSRDAAEHQQLRASVETDMERIRKGSAGVQDKELAALKALAEAATPGPWAAFTDDTHTRHTNIVAVVPRIDCVLSLPGHDKREPNIAYVAAANPAAILSLITRIEQQAARIAELEAKEEFKPDWAGYRQGLEDGAAVDLSGLTRYDYNHARDMMERAAEGDFYRVEDVWAALSAPVVREGKMTDERIEQVYQQGFDNFAGPKQFRHASNYPDYHRAGLKAVREAVEREVLATGKGDAELGLRNDDLYGGARKPFVPDATPFQAWGGELPNFDDEEISGPLCEYYGHHNYENATKPAIEAYARKAIGAAVAGVRDKALEEAAAECERMTMYEGARQESAAHDNVWEAAKAIRSLSSNPVSLREKAEQQRGDSEHKAVLTISGHLCEIGLLESESEGDAHGFVIERSSGNVMVKGLSRAEVLDLRELAFENATVTIHPASNGNGEGGAA